ncbi:sugar O-acetyltransferase [Nocardiopsis sp. HNM0947]|uniref:Sugar O-acetyltransferase n=1 Tax=Nocardiopsis coralli TaxID=2772213 RepID=A0ABR9P6S5_9ACTN|nr:sugar O-acetyltransferase [Nocardiopsis coralli]MBE2999521.1 sugar O-acetyltransferase [Nocardiopsis coralli]
MAGQKARMLAGEPYKAEDPELQADLERAEKLARAFNDTPVDTAARLQALRELLGSVGEDAYVRPPLAVDYGYRITLGAHTFVNCGAVMLDVAPITVGEYVQMGPNVQLLTPTHPLDATERKEGWESAEPITIGDNVWLGGGVIVCPGVSIGENTVVGAGSVVTKDLPANVVAVGNPARVVKEL